MKEEISEKLSDLKKYVKHLRRYREHSLEKIKEDPVLQSALERHLQIALEIVLETCEMIISNEEYEKPDTYKGVIKKLGEEGILPPDFTKKFAPSAGLRNLLVTGTAN